MDEPFVPFSHQGYNLLPDWGQLQSTTIFRVSIISGTPNGWLISWKIPSTTGRCGGTPIGNHHFLHGEAQLWTQQTRCSLASPARLDAVTPADKEHAYSPIHSIPSHCVTWYYIMYIALHCIALHYIHCITHIAYITYITHNTLNTLHTYAHVIKRTICSIIIYNTYVIRCSTNQCRVCPQNHQIAFSERLVDSRKRRGSMSPQRVWKLRGEMVSP